MNLINPILSALLLLQPLTIHSMEMSQENNLMVTSDRQKYFKLLIERRIAQGMKGDQLAQADTNDCLNLPCRLIYENCLPLLKILLEHKIDLTITHCSPLHQAVKRQNLDAIKLLISFGADPNIKEGVWINTPLHILTQNVLDNEKKALQILLYLLKKGADPNAQDYYGCTPLMNLALVENYVISRNIQIRLAKKLIQRGADVNLRSYNNLGPGSDHNNKTAAEMALLKKKYGLEIVMRETARANGQISLEPHYNGTKEKKTTYTYTWDDDYYWQ